jgi:hypothetical protein
MLHYNESIAICAQSENPFVENKPYNPDHVIGFVVTHILDGIAPGPGDSEGADYLKRLYIATIQVLMEKQMPVTESSIVQMRDEIEAKVNGIAAVSAKVETSVAATASPCYAADLQKSVKFSLAGKSLTVKKQYIQWAVIALLILLLIKIFK